MKINNPTLFCIKNRITLYPYQSIWLNAMDRQDLNIILASRRSGKALNPNEVVLTNRGWVKLKDLSLDDLVYGSDGKLAKIKFITPLMKDLDFYKITLRDGRTIECCEDHLWKVFRKNDNRDTKYPDIKWTVHDTKKMYKDFKLKRINSPHKKETGEIKYLDEYQYALPLNKPIQYSKKQLRLHPYILGCLLGDGGLTRLTTMFTSKDKEIVDKMNEFMPEGYIIKKYTQKYSYGVVRKDGGKKYKSFSNVFLKELGLSGKGSFYKFIPEIYRTSSIEDRLWLIRGLMDTDGTVSKKSAEYYTVSEQLKDDIMEVLRSLGIYTNFVMKKAYIGKKRYADCYRIKIFTDKDIFFLPRKRNLFNVPKGKQANSRYKKVFITNIEKIGKQDGMCITVDNHDSTYITKSHIVTHNTKSISFYLAYAGFTYPGANINIFAPTLQQAVRVMEDIRSFIVNNPLLYAEIDTRWGRGIAKKKIMLKNGSVFEAFGQNGNIDSANTDVAFIEETSLMESNIINERILPTLAAKSPSGIKNKIIYTGVPVYEGDALFELINNEKTGKNLLPIINWEKAVKHGGLDKATVEMIRDNISEEEFSRAFECLWAKDSSTYFSNKVIFTAQNVLKYDLNDTLQINHSLPLRTAGFDMSGGGASNISKHGFCISEDFEKNGKLCKKLIFTKHWDSDYDTSLLIDEIIEIWRDWNISTLYYDAFGKQFIIRLAEQLFGITNEEELVNTPFNEIRFSEQRKQALFLNAKMLMQQGRLALPYEDQYTYEFFRELRNMKTEKAKVKIVIKRKKKTIPDDLVDAFTLCVNSSNIAADTYSFAKKM